SVNWYPQYLDWGLPFLLLSGAVFSVALAEVALAPTLLLAYAGLEARFGLAVHVGDAATAFYVGLMDVLWLAAAIGAGVLLRRARRSARSSCRVQPPAGPLSFPE